MKTLPARMKSRPGLPGNSPDSAYTSEHRPEDSDLLQSILVTQAGLGLPAATTFWTNNQRLSRFVRSYR